MNGGNLLSELMTYLTIGEEIIAKAMTNKNEERTNRHYGQQGIV